MLTKYTIVHVPEACWLVHYVDRGKISWLCKKKNANISVTEITVCTADECIRNTFIFVNVFWNVVLIWLLKMYITFNPYTLWVVPLWQIFQGTDRILQCHLRISQVILPEATHAKLFNLITFRETFSYGRFDFTCAPFAVRLLFV